MTESYDLTKLLHDYTLNIEWNGLIDLVLSLATQKLD